jgi:hypothetical protein
LEALEQNEPDDDRTYLENITREAFQKDRGLSKGTNKEFTWAVINAFLGEENHTLLLDEKTIKSLMDVYNVKIFNYFTLIITYTYYYLYYLYLLTLIESR